MQMIKTIGGLMTTSWQRAAGRCSITPDVALSSDLLSAGVECWELSMYKS